MKGFVSSVSFISIVSMVAIVGVSASLSPAGSHEPGRDLASVSVAGGEIKIDYGTPSLNGRDLDDMIEPGFAWRMGMNAVTTLENGVALDFAGKQLPPGKYTLFARSDPQKHWTLLISSGTGARLDPETVVVEAPLRFEESPDLQETLKIRLDKDGGSIRLLVSWGHYRLHGSFKAA